MHELSKLTVLSGEPLTSPSGRYALDYEIDDISWTAILTDTENGEVLWRAGGPGWLYLGPLGVVQTAEWTSDIAAEGATTLTVSDDGSLCLLDSTGFRLYDSRTGLVRPTELRGAAPAAAITRDACLVDDSRQRRAVTRNADGSLQVTEYLEGGGAYSAPISGPLADRLAQDGTVLTWRVFPAGRRRQRMLCLVDADDRVLWRQHMQDVSAELPTAVPHEYGGATLEHGGRLRHQSLTSPSGAHTLVHQSDGNLVLYCTASDDAVWATHTWWSGDGWVDFADGDLVLRNACGADIWRAGTTSARRLTVADDGTLTLSDADGATVWTFTGHECPAPATNPGRGSVLRLGQTLHRQSLTSPDGSTVLAHGDRQLVLFDDDGTWLWNEYIPGDGPSTLTLDDDGMLRVRTSDDVVLDIAGPGDELVVGSGFVELRAAGTALWRNGAVAPLDDFTAWLAALVDLDAYCVTVIHDIEPDEALRRLGLADVEPGTWQELLDRVAEADLGGTATAAFRLGPHALVVEDMGWLGVEAPRVSAGTFAVSCLANVNGLAYFRVFRDGEVVADHGESGDAEPTVPEVTRALGEMGIDDPFQTPLRRYPELLCRTAGVRPTIADVTGPCYVAMTTVD